MSVSVSTTNLDTGTNSQTGGVIMITIADPAVSKVYGTSTPCRECYVQQLSGTQACMNIDTTAAAATSWKLSSTAWIPVAIDDVNKLHFFGTAGDIIQILYRT